MAAMGFAGMGLGVPRSYDVYLSPAALHNNGLCHEQDVIHPAQFP